MNMKAQYRIIPGAPGLISTCQSLAAQGIDYTVALASGKVNVQARRWDSKAIVQHDDFHFEIQAHGRPKPSKPKTRAEMRPAKPSAVPMTAMDCYKRLEKAEAALADAKARVRAQLRQNWDGERYNYSYSRVQSFIKSTLWWKRIAIGKVIGQIIARHKTKSPYRFTAQDYAELDRVIGTKVKRESQVSANYKGRYLYYVVSTYTFGHYYATRKRPAHHEDSTTTTPTYKNLGFAGCKPFYAETAIKAAQFTPIENYLHLKAEVEHWQEMVRLACEREERA